MKRTSIWMVLAACITAAWPQSTVLAAPGAKAGPSAISSTRSAATQPARPRRPRQHTYRVGFRVFKWTRETAGGETKPLTTAVWYPARTNKRPGRTYFEGLGGLAIQDAPADTSAGARPLVVLSHGYGGGALTAIYLTELLAAHGYVVASADHNDPLSMMRISGRTAETLPDFISVVAELVRQGENVDRNKFAYRPEELTAVIEKILAESKSKTSPLHGMIDPERIGCVGHSMGAFTCLAKIGCWPKYTDTRIKAAVLLSPPVFMCTNEQYGQIRVPVMYMFGELEHRKTLRQLGHRNGRRRKKKQKSLAELQDFARAYEHSPAPKWLIAIRRAHHLTFTNTVIIRWMGLGANAQAVAAQHRTIGAYTLAMFDKYLGKNESASATLSKGGKWTSEFKHAKPQATKPESKPTEPQKTDTSAPANTAS